MPPGLPEFPSREWAEAYCRALNENESYRAAARGWVWPILFKVREPGGGSKGFILYLRDGRCDGVEWLEDAEKGDAPFVLSAAREAWIEVISGRLNPISAIMRRKLILEKGDYSLIMRFPVAALQMVATAQKVGV